MRFLEDKLIFISKIRNYQDHNKKILAWIDELNDKGLSSTNEQITKTDWDNVNSKKDYFFHIDWDVDKHLEKQCAILGANEAEIDKVWYQQYTTNSSHYKLLNEGFEWKGVYSASTTYLIGQVVEYSSSSYVAIVTDVLGVTPGTDATKWQLVAQGSTTNVLTTRGDLVVRDATQTTRLPIGVAGSFLTTDGTDVLWSNAEGGNVQIVIQVLKHYLGKQSIIH